MPILLKLYRCFCHDLKICMWFGYYPEIIFCHFFCNLNLVIFKCTIMAGDINSLNLLVPSITDLCGKVEIQLHVMVVQTKTYRITTIQIQTANRLIQNYMQQRGGGGGGGEGGGSRKGHYFLHFNVRFS